jgi:hypothetical protein
MPAQYATSRREISLLKTVVEAKATNLRANDVKLGHAPKSELDLIRRGDVMCSDIGAHIGKVPAFPLMKPRAFISNRPVFLRRLGPDPHANGAKTSSGAGCPDIILLADGDFAVIGVDITDASCGRLPATVSCGPDEKVVRIPRSTLVLARPDIPSQ